MTTTNTIPNADVAAADPAGGALALFILVAAGVGWFALRTMVREFRARKTERAVGGDFKHYALEVLVNAAKIDGRVSDSEKAAIGSALRELAGGADVEAASIESAFVGAKLSKDELIAYLTSKSRVFSREQKTGLLRALLSVFVADGNFDEVEHHALVDYTAAVGFDRQSAPDMLRGIARDFSRGNIT
jgi:uncharacterized membrane protein YebE (DUF533 family)